MHLIADNLNLSLYCKWSSHIPVKYKTELISIRRNATNLIDYFSLYWFYHMIFATIRSLDYWIFDYSNSLLSKKSKKSTRFIPAEPLWAWAIYNGELFCGFWKSTFSAFVANWSKVKFMNSTCIGKVDEFHVKLLHFSLLLYEFHETHLFFILFFYNCRCRITISSLFAWNTYN